MISALSSNVHEGTFADYGRGVYHTVPLLKHSPTVIAAIQNETTVRHISINPQFFIDVSL